MLFNQNVNSGSFNIPILDEAPETGLAYASPIDTVFQVTSWLPITLLSSAWQNGSQTIPVQGLMTNQNLLIGIDQTLPINQFIAESQAISAAGFKITNSTANEVVFNCTGVVPSIDLHLVGGVL